MMKEKSSSKNWASIVTNIVIVLLIIIIIVNSSLIVRGNSKESLPDIFGYKFLVVLTDTMENELDKGDLIIIKERDEYNIGDIVSFRYSDDSIVTQKIESVLENGKKTQYQVGNELLTINKSDIEGACKVKIAWVGNILLFLSTPQGMCLYIAFIVLIFIIGLVVSNIKAKKEKNKSDTSDEEEIDII